MRLERLSGGKFVLFFDGDETDLSEAYIIQQNFNQTETLDDIVYVSMEGIDDDVLLDHKWIITNPKASLMNHFLWEGLFSEKEQKERLDEMIYEYFKRGKRYTIEEYEFTDTEPFFDYGDTEGSER